jgi:hypothetical protein
MISIRDLWSFLSKASDAYLARRYSFLFFSLLLTLGVQAFLFTLGYSGRILAPFLSINLIAAFIPKESSKGKKIFYLFVTSSLTLGIVTSSTSLHGASALWIGFWSVLGLFATYGCLKNTLQAREVYSEHLYAALSTYLLAGIFTGVLYWVIELVMPGSFVDRVLPIGKEFELHNAIYFSFVTLATLGYGDIVPHSGIVRGIAMIEGISGQLYLAVMVARIVTLYGTERK